MMQSKNSNSSQGRGNSKADGIDASLIGQNRLLHNLFSASVSLILYSLTALYGLVLCIIVITGRPVDPIVFASLIVMLITDGLYYFKVKAYQFLPLIGLTVLVLVGALHATYQGDFIEAVILLLQSQIILTLAYFLLPLNLSIPIILFLSVLFSIIATSYFAADQSLMILTTFLVQSTLLVFGGITKMQLQVTVHSQTQDIAQSLKSKDWQFYTLAENTQDMLLLLDTTHRILFANPPLQRLVAKHDLVGRSLHSASLPGEIAIPLRNALQEAVIERSMIMLDMRLEAMFDGSKPVFLDGQVFPQFEGDTLTGFLVVLKDVTLREHSEELFAQQAQADALKRFMREAAHDLITPLTTMKTNLYLMQHTTQDVKQLRRIELLEDQTDHIERSTQALLKMTRLEGAQFQMEAVFLNSFLSNIIAAHRTLVISREQNIIFEPDNRIAEVMLDVNEFQFVIREMLMNALVHSQSGDTTTVRTTQVDDKVVIEIEDEGDGIDPQDIDHIFEPFYRASAREIAKGGIGLGLTLSKWIVDIHRGRIEVHSDLDSGSSFSIHLPVSQNHQDGSRKKKRRTTRPVSDSQEETKEENIITRH